MFIKTANYLASYKQLWQCPPPIMPEYAFIGRSNVGKSSLINLLTNNKGLAKVSGKPGKTQAINYFIINESWYLVDLPGYGYAKSSQKEREAWKKMIETYLAGRESLQCVFLLIDSRHEPQQIDITFANWLGEVGLPFVLVFTKSDKASNKAVQTNIAAFKKEMLKYWEEVPQIFVTSAEEKVGHEDILTFIDGVNN